jgi:hypothetical protein
MLMLIKELVKLSCDVSLFYFIITAARENEILAYPQQFFFFFFKMSETRLFSLRSTVCESQQHPQLSCAVNDNATW